MKCYATNLMQALLFILTAQANKPFQSTAQLARVQTAMAARQKPVLNQQPNPADNTVYPLPQDPRIHHDHPQSIGINHPLTFNNSINNSNQSFSALLHEVHDTLELGAGYQNIDRPAPSTYHQPFTCSTPKQSPTTFMNSLEVQELQKEVSLLKSAVEVLHDEVRALKKKLKVIV